MRNLARKILRGRSRKNEIIIKTPEQIEGIRRSCRLAAEALDFIEPHVQEGVSTDALDRMLEEFIRDHGAVPAPKGYRGYPRATCISLNEVVCHGIPSERIVLKKGDILNIDVTTILDGYYGDTSRMYAVEPISDAARRLLKVTKECLDLGIAQVRPGNRFGAIGAAIETHARAHGYGVVYQFCGHGVGLKFHEPPDVMHVGRPHDGPVMKPGMIFTIEPMINEGKSRVTVDAADGWTARTIDRKLSAQYEHTVLVTPTGHEVLTDIHGEYPAT